MKSKAVSFAFTSYVFDPKKKRIVFNYKISFQKRRPLTFTETILLPQTPNLKHINKKLIKKLLESLHMVLGISYYKFYCPKNVKLPYQLSKKEAEFWNVVYRKGLGEFFYRNKLNPNISPKFPFKKNVKNISYAIPLISHKSLVGIGGGKDSIVVAELLKRKGIDFATFSVETDRRSQLINEVSKLVGKKHLVIQRKLDEKVHDKHPYNGHVPISAIYAFLGLFSSVLYGYTYVIVGNEYSSNFGNIKYLPAGRQGKGVEINHQWSKSFEFEQLFQDYVKSFITGDVQYFSLLRRFYEIRVSKLFTQHGKKYFKHFSSCNRNFSTANRLGGGLWCNECPKCVFTFTMLSAFLPKKELLNIFGKNLYRQRALLPIFKDILGFGKMKPFDCVGTFEEAQSTLFLAKNHYKNDFIVRQLSKRAKYNKNLLKLKRESKAPEEFKLLGAENTLIVGYGREGKISEKYLKKCYSELKIGIGDEKQGSSYLRVQNNYDIALKTPGIPKELVTIPYTTATNIFFSRIQKIPGSFTIGVTGSKGKSTTASLIYHILKAADKNVMLLGNIGKPMLEYFLKPLGENTIFVLELSSYQLDDIEFSPNIAVVTNLFEEHMDYHKNVANYFAAKKNIIDFQNSNGFFVYNQKNKIMAQWLKNYQGKAVPFVKKHFEGSLLGQHNQENIRAAVAVANILKINKKTIQKAIKNFTGLPHRLEFIGKFKGILFYDDAISTTPESTIMAIRALKNVDTIFLGGEDRGYHFSSLEKELKRYNIRNVVLFPDSGSRIKVKGLSVLKTRSMQKAVAFAYKNTEKGKICLLSCASPSYSLWKNFEEKGDQFKYFVRKLSK